MPTTCPCKNLAVPFGAHLPVAIGPVTQQQQVQLYQPQVPNPFYQQAPTPITQGLFGLPSLPNIITPTDPIENAVTQMLAQYPHLRREQVLPIAQEAVNKASAAELQALRQQLGFQNQPYQPLDTPTAAPPGDIVINTDTLTPYGWHQVRDHFLFEAKIHNDNEAWNVKLREQITQNLLLPHAQRFKPTASKTRITFVEIQTNIAGHANASYQVFVGLYDQPVAATALTNEIRRAALCGTTITDDQQERRTLTLPVPRCPVANETYVGVWQLRVGADPAQAEIGAVTLSFGFEYQ